MKKVHYQPQDIRDISGKKRTVAVVTALVACVLIVAVGVGTALAYFTDRVHVDTTFTFGNVEIVPGEPDYPPDDPPDTPNEETKKNPLIANNGTELCIVFMEVRVPVATFRLVSDDGLQADEVTTEVFWLKTDDLTPDVHQTKFRDVGTGGHWVQLRCTPGKADGEYTTYLFGYLLPLDGTNQRIDEVLNPGWGDIAALAYTEPLFDKVQMKNYLEGTLNGNYSIVINSYGIQADYLKDENGDYLFDGDGAFGETVLTAKLLETIWSVYGTQMS